MTSGGMGVKWSAILMASKAGWISMPDSIGSSVVEVAMLHVESPIASAS